MLTDIFNSNYQCYGYRRLHAMLRHEGGRLSEKVVRRLMVEEQLVVSRNRRRRYSSYCGEIGPAPDNLIARDFKAEQPGVLRRNPRFFRYPSFKPATNVSRSISSLLF